MLDDCTFVWTASDEAMRERIAWFAQPERSGRRSTDTRSIRERLISSYTHGMAKRNPRGLKVHDVRSFLDELLGEDLHAKRVLSIANGVTGVIHAAAASVHAIGRGLALAAGLEPRHAVKQVDRLLSNSGVDVWELFADWVPFVLAERDEALVALDWTEFDADDQATIAAHLVSSHGRATPLVWKTVKKSELEGNRNRFEDEVVGRLVECAPPLTQIKITIIADRAFGDRKLYEGLDRTGLQYIIRFRECILVEDESRTSKPAGDWVPANGRAVLIRNAAVTNDRTRIPAVVVVKKKGMKEAWCLATNCDDLKAAEIIDRYARRFTIEESFRDTKNLHFGLGLSATHIGRPQRRDRLLFLIAIAQALLTLLGAAAEKIGLDRVMNTNTTKKRQYSLFSQGSFWYSAIPTMKQERLELLMNAFGEIVAQHALFKRTFGVL